MQKFRRDYNGELTDTLVEKLLFELNRIWSRRETGRLNRLKNQYSAEIQRLERKVSNHPSYKEVQSKQTITRLRNDLKGAYKDNRQAFAERTDKYVKLSLPSLTSFSVETRLVSITLVKQFGWPIRHLAIRRHCRRRTSN